MSYKSSVEQKKDIFCDNIRYLRKSINLSKKEMANLLGIGLHSLNLLEKGMIPPRLSVQILYNIYHQFGLLPSQQLGEKQK